MSEGFKVRHRRGEVWDGYLYRLGDEYPRITGGWIVTGSAAKYDTYIRCLATAQKQANAYTANKIDLTPYTKLYITISNVVTDLFIGVPSEIKSTVNATQSAARPKIQPTSAGTYSINISGVNEPRYIWCGNWSESSNSFGARVTAVWLE